MRATAGGEPLRQPLMSQDPFYIARDEIDNGLASVHAMITELRREKNPQRAQKLSHEAVAEIKQLQYDLQDAEATIGIVQSNPARYQVSSAELESRKQFVKRTETKLKDMIASVKNTIEDRGTSAPSSSRSGTSGASGSSAYPGGGAGAPPGVGATTEMDDFVGRTGQHQNMLLGQQDEQLDALSKATERLGETAVTINRELGEQARMLSELDDDIDRETEKMNFVMRRLGLLLRSSDSKQLWLILMLFCVFMFLLMLIIA